MKAAVLYQDGDIRYEEIPMPEVGPGEVKVRVRAAGICGSDIPRVFSGGSFCYPMVLGHEFSGEVVEVAVDVSRVRVGDYVVGAPLIPCMECAECLSGNYASCKQYNFMGSKRQGAFCDYIVMPAMCAVVFDKSIPFVHAAMFEPATVGLHGVLGSGFQGGGTVAILGGGTIGLFTMQWAKIFGAKEIVVFDIDDSRLAFLKEYGADATINTKQADFLSQAMTLTHGHGFDQVFETAGQSATMNIAFQIAATKGNICMIGNPNRPVTFDPITWELLNRKELHMEGSWMSYSAPYPGREWSLVAHFLKEKKLCISEDLIYKIHPMHEALKAFEHYQRGSVPGKVMLVNED